MSSSYSAAPCYHCGLAVPAGANFEVVIAGRSEPMCCIGCQAVAMAIVDGGLENFYRFRTEKNARPHGNEQQRIEQWQVFDLPEVQADFVVPLDAEAQMLQANLLLDDISCAACAWLIETHLKKFPAVTSVTINITTHRCHLVWNAHQQVLSELLLALADIGYRPYPATDERQQEFLKKENRSALFRLGVAGFGMMQTMMVAIGMYTGAADAWLELLRWLSLLVATPVVFFSCWPFFKSAWRSIRSRHLIMDVPVALAIGLAYLASTWGTVFSQGEVYFESISMFAFFLLLGRYVEMRARHRNRQAFGNIAQLMPLTACCLREQDGVLVEQQLPLKLLQIDDRVLVRAGETFPCDGVVETGVSSAVEAVLTGEFNPVSKSTGDNVIAGTLNGDSPLQIRVTAIGGATQLSAIERLAAQAAEEKPQQVTFADKIAQFFIARLLIVCACVFAFWWWYEPARALWVCVSVLVVTCPCALALAMPAALSAATANLRQRGFLVARGHVIETLTAINRVMLDKTGTLTKGQFVVADVLVCGALESTACLQLAAALETHINHPIAMAFRPWQKIYQAQSVQQVTAAGVEGNINDIQYRLGTLDYVQELFVEPDLQLSLPDNEKLWLLLGSAQGPLAWFALIDELRSDAKQLVDALTKEGIAVELLSGDQSGAVKKLADELGLSNYIAGAKPQDKLSHLHAAQARGDKVLMLGDGINDVPVLSGADVSVAMASASDLAQTRADAVLLSEHLLLLPQAIYLAHFTQRIIKQNLGFSLTYNVLALPIAAAGLLAPWQAAIGMTTSSLIVILNSLRLNSVGRDKPDSRLDVPLDVPLELPLATELNPHLDQHQQTHNYRKG